MLNGGCSGAGGMRVDVTPRQVDVAVLDAPPAHLLTLSAANTATATEGAAAVPSAAALELAPTRLVIPIGPDARDGGEPAHTSVSVKPGAAAAVSEATGGGDDASPVPYTIRRVLPTPPVLHRDRFLDGRNWCEPNAACASNCVFGSIGILMYAGFLFNVTAILLYYFLSPGGMFPSEAYQNLWSYLVLISLLYITPRRIEGLLRHVGACLCVCCRNGRGSDPGVSVQYVREWHAYGSTASTDVLGRMSRAVFMRGVLPFLGDGDLWTASCVSREWRAVTTHKSVWLPHVQLRYPQVADHLAAQETHALATQDWHTVYRLQVMNRREQPHVAPTMRKQAVAGVWRRPHPATVSPEALAFFTADATVAGNSVDAPKPEGSTDSSGYDCCLCCYTMCPCECPDGTELEVTVRYNALAESRRAAAPSTARRPYVRTTPERMWTQARSDLRTDRCRCVPTARRCAALPAALVTMFWCVQFVFCAALWRVYNGHHFMADDSHAARVVVVFNLWSGVVMIGGGVMTLTWETTALLHKTVAVAESQAAQMASGVVFALATLRAAIDPNAPAAVPNAPTAPAQAGGLGVGPAASRRPFAPVTPAVYRTAMAPLQQWAQALIRQVMTLEPLWTAVYLAAGYTVSLCAAWLATSAVWFAQPSLRRPAAIGEPLPDGSTVQPLNAVDPLWFQLLLIAVLLGAGVIPVALYFVRCVEPLWAAHDTALREAAALLRGCAPPSQTRAALAALPPNENVREMHAQLLEVVAELRRLVSPSAAEAEALPAPPPASGFLTALIADGTLRTGAIPGRLGAHSLIGHLRRVLWCAGALVYCTIALSTWLYWYRQ